MTDTTHLQKQLDEANPGETVSLEPRTYQIERLTIPNDVILRGAGNGPRGTVLTNSVPINDWKEYDTGIYYANVDFVPAILTIDGKQVGQMDSAKMETGTRKTFNYSGFDLMKSPTKLTIKTEWNGVGDFWKALDALWGYNKGRIYLRLKDKSKPPTGNRVRISPEFDGMRIREGATMRDVGSIGYEKTVDFRGDAANLFNCTIYNGNERVKLENHSGCTISNCDISMNFCGKRPNAWQGGNAEGEILYRFYKYFQGGSSSDDVSIQLSNIGGGNRLSRNYIHDGAIGIRQTSASRRTSGKLEIDYNVIGYHNSVGLVWGFVNDDSHPYGNFYHNNNIHIRGWRLQLSGPRIFYFNDNFYYNPKGLGGVVYGHTTGGVHHISSGIMWNQSDEVMVGGRDYFNFPFGQPKGVRKNNHQGGLTVYDWTRTMDFMGADKHYFDEIKTPKEYPGPQIVPDEPPETPPKDDEEDDDDSPPVDDEPPEDPRIKEYREKLKQIQDLSTPKSSD